MRKPKTSPITNGTPPLSPVKEKLRTSEIVHVAAELFTADGYTKTSLDTIAGSVGIHKATLYHYFDSKDSILANCLQLASADLELALRYLKQPDEPPLDRVGYFFKTLAIAQSGLYGRCIAMVASEGLNHEPIRAIRSYQESLQQAVASCLAEAVPASRTFGTSPALAAGSLYGAFNWLHRWYSPGKGSTLADITDAFMDIASHGLAGQHLKRKPLPAAPAAPASDQPLDRRAEIVLYATRCFTTKGYDAASIGDISQAAGLQKASLYHYFSSKAAILAACVELAYQDVEAILGTVTKSSRPFGERFVGFLRRLMQSQNSEYGIYLYMVRDEQLDEATAATVRDFKKRLTHTLRNLIEEGIAGGYLRQVTPSLAAAYIFGVTNWVPHWHSRTDGGELNEVIEDILALLMSGLAPKR